MNPLVAGLCRRGSGIILFGSSILSLIQYCGVGRLILETMETNAPTMLNSSQAGSVCDSLGSMKLTISPERRGIADQLDRTAPRDGGVACELVHTVSSELAWSSHCSGYRRVLLLRKGQCTSLPSIRVVNEGSNAGVMTVDMEHTVAFVIRSKAFKCEVVLLRSGCRTHGIVALSNTTCRESVSCG